MQEWLSGAWRTVQDVWTFELFTIEGTTLSVGRLLVATALIILAVFLSRRVSNLLGRRILPRFHISPGAIAALQSLTFYVLLAFFTLSALRLASVPLTVFAVLGGAVAIGVGFGSQNIVNNFISGIILMIEQPVKPGDLIEVEGTLGTVERIGTRSTMVRTPDNTHIVVPNSSLLEKPVLNWTLSDNTIRVQISVGVAYGSDVARVRDVIEAATQAHTEILKDPSPIVIFADFGDNALVFEAVFWLRLLTATDRRRIQSDLRFAIHAAFGEAGIVVAFPQRDIHVDGIGPLEVRMVGS